MEQGSILTDNNRLTNSSYIDNSITITGNNDCTKRTESIEAIKVLELNKSSSLNLSPSFGRRKFYKTNIMSNGLTHEQLKEIYSSCIRLSSENKINIKNAFGLQLIDYMQDLLTSNNRNDSSTNFQVAGCTLDASVKIYSYRVDSVHSDAVKIAGTLGSEQPPTNMDESDSLPDDNIDVDHKNSSISQKQRKSKKLKRNNKNLLTKIEKNIKNINLEFLDYDSCDNNSKNCFTFGHTDLNAINSLLLSNVGSCSDKGDYTIDPSSKIFSSVKESVWNEDNLETDNDALKNILKDLYDNDNCLKTIDNLIGIVDYFKFERWEKPAHLAATSVLDNINVLTGIVDNESDRSAIEKHRKTLLRSVIMDTLNSMDETLKHDQSGLASDHNDSFISDEVTQHPINNDDLPDFPQQTSAIEFEFPNKSEAGITKTGSNLSVVTAFTNAISLATNSNVPLNMTGGLTLELSIEPGEYSYFKNLHNMQKNVAQIPNMWAGPQHWKHFTRSFIRNDDSAFPNSGLVNKAISKTRNQRKRKQLNNDANFATNMLGVICETVNFNEVLSADSKKCLKIGKASCTFSKTILSTSNIESITLPEADPINIKPLFQLFLMPNIRLNQALGDKNNDDIPMITLGDNQIYNYNNDNDRLNYCSGIFDDISDHNPFNDVGYNQCASGYPSPFKPSFRPAIFQDDNKGGIFSVATQLFGGMSQPNRIEYAKFAKRFDTRQIKTTLWNILQVTTDDAIKTESQSKFVDDDNIDQLKFEAKMEDLESIPDNYTMFNSVYNSLIDKLPEKSAQNVSIPIALVCLLHLANEKNLTLEGNDQLNNIQIKLNNHI